MREIKALTFDTFGMRSLAGTRSKLQGSRLRSLATCILYLATCALPAATAHGQQGWKPTRPVTLIAPNAPGGTSDRTAREIQRLFQKHGLVDVAVNVVNRPGGGGTIAMNQLQAHPGDGHLLLVATSASISNYITGLKPTTTPTSHPSRCCSATTMASMCAPARRYGRRTRCSTG